MRSPGLLSPRVRRIAPRNGSSLVFWWTFTPSWRSVSPRPNGRMAAARFVRQEFAAGRAPHGVFDAGRHRAQARQVRPQAAVPADEPALDGHRPAADEVLAHVLRV